MNCQECRDYIDPYFDSELDAGDGIQVKHQEQTYYQRVSMAC